MSGDYQTEGQYQDGSQQAGGNAYKMMMPRMVQPGGTDWVTSYTQAGTYQQQGNTQSPFTYIPPINDPNFDILEIYPLRAPFSYVRVLFKKDSAEWIYEVIEPQLSDNDKEMLALVKDTLERTLEYDWEKISASDNARYIKESVDNLPEFGIDKGEGTVTVTKVNEEDWENNWKKYYHPFYITNGILIKPSWEKNFRKELIMNLV